MCTCPPCECCNLPDNVCVNEPCSCAESAENGCSCTALAARLAHRPDVARVEVLTPEEVGELSPAAFLGSNPDVSICPRCEWGYVIVPASRVVADLVSVGGRL